MEDITCPKCGSKNWQTSANKDRCYCMVCKKTFELTEVNAWYKGTILEKRDMEFDKNNE